MNINELKKKLLKDEVLKEAYDEFDFQYQIIKELIKLRNSYQMTIEEFASLCKIDANSLHQIEMGEILPNINTIQSIVNQTNNKIQFKIIKDNII